MYVGLHNVDWLIVWRVEGQTQRCRMSGSWCRGFPVGLWKPEAPVLLDHHSREFCLQLSGQVATRSARIRVEQATPVIHSYLMTGFRLWFLVGSLLSSLSHLASHLELNPLWLFILEDKGYVANLYQNKSDGLWGESVEGSGRKQLSSEVNDGQKKNNHILFMVIKCLALAS